jgi:hypothetical protein
MIGISSKYSLDILLLMRVRKHHRMTLPLLLRKEKNKQVIITLKIVKITSNNHQVLIENQIQIRKPKERKP